MGASPRAFATQPWERTGVAYGTGVAAYRRSSGEVLLFDLRRDYLCVQSTWTGIEFGPATCGTIGQASDLSVASTDGGTTVTAFYRDGEKKSRALLWNGSAWTTTSGPPLDGVHLAGPGAAGRSGRVDLFSIGLNRTVWHAAKDSGGWSGWFNELGAPANVTLATLSPATVWGAGGTLHVFVVATNGTAWTRRYPPGGPWSPWVTLSGSFASALAATTWGAEIDVFGVSAVDGKVYRLHSRDDGQTWQPASLWWESLGVPADLDKYTVESASFYRAPGAVSTGQERFTVYVRTGDSARSIYQYSALGEPQLSHIKPVGPSSGFGEDTAALAQNACPGEAAFLSQGGNTTLSRTRSACFSTAGGTCDGQSACCARDVIRFPGAYNYGQPSTPTDGTFVVDVQLPSGVTLKTPGALGSSDNHVVSMADGSIVALWGAVIRTNNTNPGDTACAGQLISTGAILAWRSTDCGRTWTPTGLFNPCAIAGVYCHDPGAPSCSSNDLSGADFPQVTVDGSSLYMAVNLYGSDRKSLTFMSDNHGASWNQVATQDIKIWVPIFITHTPSKLVRAGVEDTQDMPTLFIDAKAGGGQGSTLPLTGFLKYAVTASDRYTEGVRMRPAGSGREGEFVRVAYASCDAPLSSCPNGWFVSTALVRVTGTPSVVADTRVDIAATNGATIDYVMLVGDRTQVLTWTETWKDAVGQTRSAQKFVVLRGRIRSSVRTLATWSGFASNGHYKDAAHRYDAATNTDVFMVHWQDGLWTPQAAMIRIPR
ncbi:MAG TPA: hypothetical protein VK447_06465 [Myxococcaceae bacterium]|nr:hypothetical protein [Myxococcaceae bacterium]